MMAQYQMEGKEKDDPVNLTKYKLTHIENQSACLGMK